jgi:diguanylate cyclase (GGDEF)-like protein/PAS domain S-box-containing protein
MGDQRTSVPEPAPEVAADRWSTMFDASPIGMAETGLDGVVLRFNPALDSLTGQLATGEMTSVFELVHPDDRADLFDLVEQVVRGAVTKWSATCRLRRGVPESLLSEVVVSRLVSPTGEFNRLLFFFVDLSTEHHLRTEIERLITHDPLTGVANEIGLNGAFERRVSLTDQGSGGLLVLSIDGLAALEASDRHDLAKGLIVQLAQVIDREIRRDDLLARLETNEFALLLPSVSWEGLERVANSLLHEVRNQLIAPIDDVLQQFPISVGGALYDESATPRQVLGAARAALRMARDSGGNCLFVSEHGRPAPGGDRMRRDSSRIDDERFVLLAQPIRQLADGATNHFEVVVRMVGEDNELILPTEFLPTAERLGKAGRVERWVIDHAIDLAAANEADSIFHVNLFGRSLGDPHMMGFIDHTIYASGVDPRCLVFEVGKQSAAANVTFAREFSDHLSHMGVRFAIDHMGAGMESFRYLDALPFDYLRLDATFVTHATGSQANQLIIEALTDIAHRLQKQVIASSVEDDETLRFLSDAGVDYVLGELIGAPQRIEALGLIEPGSERDVRASRAATSPKRSRVGDMFSLRRHWPEPRGDRRGTHVA